MRAFRIYSPIRGEARRGAILLWQSTDAPTLTPPLWGRGMALACITALSLTACGYKGPLKSPKQIAQQEAKKAAKKTDAVSANDAATSTLIPSEQTHGPF